MFASGRELVSHERQGYTPPVRPSGAIRDHEFGLTLPAAEQR
jgi:hypothetical protein